MINREQVWRKYDGHCAYCGHEITLQEMQVDHIIPKRNGGSDDMSNLNPACRLCNQYKRANSLDIFRYWLLEGIIGRLLKLFIFRVAQRYGLITINKTRIDGFYFESIKRTKKMQTSELTLEELLNRLPQPLYYANRRQAVFYITKAHNGAWFVTYEFKSDRIVRSGKTLAEAAAGMLEWLSNPKNIQTYKIKGNETNN